MTILLDEADYIAQETYNLNRAQRLRLKRFSMALATYGMAVFVTFLVTHLGLGSLTVSQWALFLGVAFFGNGIFFLLFASGLNLRFQDPSLTWLQIVFSASWGTILLYLLPAARTIILMFYLPAFSFGMFNLNRRKYLSALVVVLGMYASVIAVEHLQEHPGFRLEYELSLFAIYSILLTWMVIFGEYVSRMRRNLKTRTMELENTLDSLRWEIEERRRIQGEKDILIADLKQAMAEVKTLRGLIPICSSCKNIRDDQGYWKRIDTYLSDHSEMVFTHGLCPECLKKLYPEVDLG